MRRIIETLLTNVTFLGFEPSWVWPSWVWPSWECTVMAYVHVVALSYSYYKKSEKRKSVTFFGLAFLGLAFLGVHCDRVNVVAC